jgi:exonuclease SbcC
MSARLLGRLGNITMLITRVELENIKSYRQINLDFRRGTTAISGVNGAGKTTIVEAIGFALFDFLLYNQAQFVREGEKYGRVVIHLIGSDDRAYTVERRCGAGAYWLVYDQEADYRVEQRTDVLDKLHKLFGIDPERSLKALFRDALGVPQGSFTSIFLEAGSERKLKFDALLQIEDYKSAADYLLDAQKEYKEQLQTQLNEIQRLEFETRDLDEWRTDLKEKRLLDQQQTTQIAALTGQLKQLEERFTALTKQRDELMQSESRYEKSRHTLATMLERLDERRQELELARRARQAVETSRVDYHRYQEAEEALKRLRLDAQRRNTLRQQHGSLSSALAKIQTTIAHLQVRLDEVAAARQRVIDLLSSVDEQLELEKQRDELTRKTAQYDELVKEGKRLVQQYTGFLQQQEALQRQVSEIEPLQPVAALLQERIEAVARLRAQLNERSSRQRTLNEKRELLRQKQEERETGAARLRKAESAIAKIEEHRAEAEELPALQEQYGQFSEQRYRLEGNIEGYVKSRKQSAGGLCPLLHEPCLNIKQRGIVSLESYFDGLLEDDRGRLVVIGQQQSAVAERVDTVKKYAEALDKLGQHVEQRDNYVEYLQRLALEIARLEREIAGLMDELETLKHVDQQINTEENARKESQKADDQVRGLEGLRMQLQQLQEQARQCDALIQERRQQAKELGNSHEQLKQVGLELGKLNDPRGQTKAQRDIIKQEPAYQQQREAQQQELQSVEQQLQALEQQLAAYAELDANTSEQEAVLQQALNGYKNYMTNAQAALLLPQREQAFHEIQLAVEQAQQAFAKDEQAYLEAKSAYDPRELVIVDAEIKDRRATFTELVGKIQQTQKDIRDLERGIQKAEAFLLELEAAQKEKATLEELQQMMELFRKLIKEAAPYVLKAMLGDISAEANRIFGEIMGDRAAQLSWQNDYEIILRRQGVNRTFAQLSGGEQMSAALSVRLALLKKLSTLNIAFFDEPTQNMDELRRMNLAEQIRRVRGFDQLIVISHDDTFEQGLDSLVRLRKVDGETRLVTEDHEEWETTAKDREQVQAVQSHAS